MKDASRRCQQPLLERSESRDVLVPVFGLVQMHQAQCRKPARLSKKKDTPVLLLLKMKMAMPVS